MNMESYNSQRDGRSGRQSDLALAYARDNYPVFPVCPRTKRPHTKHGFHDATTDKGAIRSWWQRWPSALVAIPVRSATTLWVIDVDGPIGRTSLAALMARLGVALLADLSPLVVATPGGGLHIYFRLRSGELPRSRAGDIGAGLDTRGEGGYIITPGNVLPDGRSYRHIGPGHDLTEASAAPRELLYLAAFNARERSEIAATGDLERAIEAAPASEWRRLLDAHRAEKAERIRARMAARPSDSDAMRRQAGHDLSAEAGRYATLKDGRRNELFRAVCRVAKYAANGVLAAAEIVEAFVAAAEANGALARYGLAWVRGTVQRALQCGADDPLPPLARKFREGAA
jgi:hypothetical protein